jgi:hypothetical protein
VSRLARKREVLHAGRRLSRSNDYEQSIVTPQAAECRVVEPLLCQGNEEQIELKWL